MFDQFCVLKVIQIDQQILKYFAIQLIDFSFIYLNILNNCLKGFFFCIKMNCFD
jgi:hypothetical protein